VALARVVGANRAYIIERLPHISDLLVDDIERALEHGEVLIAGTAIPEVIAAIASAPTDRLIVDLVRLPEAVKLRFADNYRGIAW
jgi:GDP-mannose 6-dehydrogenase